jgi:hypothetical protein
VTYFYPAQLLVQRTILCELLRGEGTCYIVLQPAHKNVTYACFFETAVCKLCMTLRQSATGVQFETTDHISLLCVAAGLRMNDLVVSIFLFDVTSEEL